MATPTSISASVDLVEYSRFEPDKNTVSVAITVVDSALGIFTDESIKVSIYKARRARDIEVATQSVIVNGQSPQVVTVKFNLNEIVDLNNAPKMRRGMYFIKVASNSDSDINAVSSDFKVSMISVDRFRKNYLNGLDLRALNLFAPLSVKDQPFIITGVTVTEVSSGHPLIWAKLSYNYNSDGNMPPTIVRTISWCGGPSFPIVPGKNIYTLRGSGDSYIVVQINQALLPTTSHEEDLLVVRSLFEDQNIQEAIDEAISWIEDDVLSVYLEPTIALTEIDLTSISFQEGSDIPVFNAIDWDVIVQPLTYYQPTGDHWMSLKMTHYPVIQFSTLYGKLAGQRIVDFNLAWIQFHEQFGFVEIVPVDGVTEFNFIGILWTNTAYGTTPIPNFWHFNALLGYRDTPKVLLELIGKKAAVSALIKLGQAFRTGIASQSISRDGVSESVSFIASNPLGIYGPVIKAYEDWIETELPRLRGAFRGMNLQVV